MKIYWSNFIDSLTAFLVGILIYFISFKFTLFQLMINTLILNLLIIVTVNKFYAINQFNINLIIKNQNKNEFFKNLKYYQLNLLARFIEILNQNIEIIVNVLNGENMFITFILLFILIILSFLAKFLKLKNLLLIVHLILFIMPKSIQIILKSEKLKMKFISYYKIIAENTNKFIENKIKPG